MFDLNVVVNKEIQNAYLQGRRDMADEIMAIFDKYLLLDDPNELHLQVINKLFAEHGIM